MRKDSKIPVAPSMSPEIRISVHADVSLHVRVSVADTEFVNGASELIIIDLP